MFIATGKHTVSDGGEEFEFDNSDGSSIPNYRNSLKLSENCGAFITGKYPHLFKCVDDLPPLSARPIKIDDIGAGFVRLRPTNPPVAPVQQPAQSAPEAPQEKVNITAPSDVPPAPKSRIYGKGKRPEAV
jgi:hypothetical protein